MKKKQSKITEFPEELPFIGNKMSAEKKRNYDFILKTLNELCEENGVIERVIENPPDPHREDASVLILIHLFGFIDDMNKIDIMHVIDRADTTYIKAADDGYILVTFIVEDVWEA